MTRNGKNPALAAILYSLQLDDDVQTFLRLWAHGEFDAIRAEWPDYPRVVFDGAEVSRNA